MDGKLKTPLIYMNDQIKLATFRLSLQVDQRNSIIDTQITKYTNSIGNIVTKWESSEIENSTKCGF
jgi:hypothetical protein